MFRRSRNRPARKRDIRRISAPSQRQLQADFVDALGHAYADTWSSDAHGHWIECTRCMKRAKCMLIRTSGSSTKKRPQKQKVCVMNGAWSAAMKQKPSSFQSWRRPRRRNRYGCRPPINGVGRSGRALHAGHRRSASKKTPALRCRNIPKAKLYKKGCVRTSDL